MSPELLKLLFNVVFYAVAAVIVVWMLVRLSRKSRTSETLPPNSKPAPVPAAPAAPVPPVIQASPPVVPQATPLETPPPLVVPTPASSPAVIPRAAAQSSASSTTAPTLSGTASPPSGNTPPHPLYQGIGRTAPNNPYQLARLEAADTPLAGKEDMVFGAATPLLSALLPESDARKAEVKRELGNAGYYQPHAIQNLAAIRYLGIILPLVFFGLLLLVVPRQLERFVLMGLIGGPLLGWAVPRLYVKSKAADRVSQIERAMPDMLDMLNMCVSQGMTVQTALQRVSDDLADVHPELHRELQIVTEQARIGTLPHALENFSRRIDTPEVHSFTSLLIQTERMGTSVSAALAEYSDNMRQSLKQRADEKGNRAAFKLLFPTVACLMPAVYMILLGPSTLALSAFFKRDDRTLQQASQAMQNSARLQQQSRSR